MGRKRKPGAVAVSGPWVPVPLELIRSRAFAQLSPHAAKLFFDLAAQLDRNAKGNGDLSATAQFLKARGWSSMSTLSAALEELLGAGLVAKTRQGGRRRCSLFALTPWPLDCDLSKLDVKPGSYGAADWTKGERTLAEVPTSEAPAIWNRPRRGDF